MTFRELILFHAATHVVTGDPEAPRRAASLCRGFGVDFRAIHAEFARRYPRTAAAVERAQPLPEVDAAFPPDARRQVVRLRLEAAALVVKESRALSASMRGVAVVDGCCVRVCRANDELLEFLARRYDPAVYRYAEVPSPSVRPGSKVFACAGRSVTFAAAHRSRITANRPLRVVVTEACVDGVLARGAAEVFDRGSGVLPRALREIFYRLDEDGCPTGQTPGFADSMASRS
ncbi:Late transcription elongation factor [Orf virus]|uniref:Late transcription elongation factor OPG087 n=2 Tax=Orf virus TaxID=10258 RepID=A0A0R8I557_ORFV|nr:late transcription factor elongation factor [Orf virus]AKU76527.1 Late transcription elongation factor [Orf virus]AKU76659.1 Late transcription elongation factor [Orf virus]AKU76791.1 Late transcription elongation factor [Orf virus]